MYHLLIILNSTFSNHLMWVTPDRNTPFSSISLLFVGESLHRKAGICRDVEYYSLDVDMNSDALNDTRLSPICSVIGPPFDNLPLVWFPNRCRRMRICVSTSSSACPAHCWFSACTNKCKRSCVITGLLQYKALRWNSSDHRPTHSRYR